MLETVAAQGQQDLAANGPTTSRSQGLAELAPSELGKHVLGELERAEANGEERDLLFARLERLVDEVTESEEIGPPQEIHWHTDEAGNLRAFLEEFFWEHRKMRGEDYPEERKQALEDFARELESREVREIEGVAERHLAQILAPSWAQGGEASCLATVAALVDWEDWLKEVQELDFACNVQGFHGRLLTDRKRLASLTRQLGCRPAEAGAPQETAMAWTVQEGNAKEGWLLRGGGRELRLPGTLHFRLGDLILGQHVVTDGETDGTFREGVRLLPASLASGLLV